MDMGNFLCLPMERNTTIKIYVLQIIANAGDGDQISLKEIVAHILTTNIDVIITLDHILRVSIHLILSSSITTYENGKVERVYGLTSLCKYLLQNKDGVSLDPLVLMNQDKVLMEWWYYLKDVVLEGTKPFTKEYEVNVF
eukprot:Gb_28237 [translate_table: standard]